MPGEVESGYGGRLISLAGVFGRPGKGRIKTCDSISLSLAQQQIISDNPNRIALLLANNAAALIYVSLGTDALGSITLSPGQSLQIDANFPWTGPISAYAAVDLTVLTWVEISVQ